MEAKPINLFLNTDIKTLVYLFICITIAVITRGVYSILFLKPSFQHKKEENYSFDQPSKFPQRYFLIIKVNINIVCGKEFIVSFSVSCKTIEWPRENFNFQGPGLKKGVATKVIVQKKHGVSRRC